LKIAAAIMPILLLAGCSAAGSSSGGATADFSVDSPARGGVSTEDLQKGEEQPEPLESARAVVTSGTMTLVVDELTSSSKELMSLVAKYSGRVEQRSESPSTEYSPGSFSYTLRLPSERVDKALEELKTLGEVQEVNIQSSDVTLQYQDMKARIGALEAGVQRLTELLATASSPESLITIENAITDRQMQLDSLKAQELRLSELVAESTITVELITEAEEVKSAPANYLDGVTQGWDALLGFAAGLLAVLGVLTPWLIPLAFILGIVVLVRRTVKRKKSQGHTADST